MAGTVSGARMARKTTHRLDGQYVDVDRIPCGTVNPNDRGHR